VYRYALCANTSTMTLLLVLYSTVQYCAALGLYCTGSCGVPVPLSCTVQYCADVVYSFLCTVQLWGGAPGARHGVAPAGRREWGDRTHRNQNSNGGQQERGGCRGGRPRARAFYTPGRPGHEFTGQGSASGSPRRTLGLFQRFLCLAAWCDAPRQHGAAQHAAGAARAHGARGWGGRPGPRSRRCSGGALRGGAVSLDCIEAIAWSQGTGTTQPQHSVAARSVLRGHRTHTLGSCQE